MANENYTKGNWNHYRIGSDRFDFGIKSEENNNPICFLPDMHDGYGRSGVQSEANAKLISAAPELYEALSQLVSWIKEGDYDQSFINQAENALAKAMS